MARKVYTYNDDGKNRKVKYSWWSKDISPEDRFQHVIPVVMGILQKQQYRVLNNLKFARLYHNMELLGLDPGMYSRVAQQDSYLTNRVTLNVIKSCIDTAASKIGKSKPRAFFLTEDGDWNAQRKAKKLTSYLDGWADASKLYQITPRSFIDGCAFGTGPVKLYRENDEVKAERVIVSELVVDEAEGMYGTPRQMHQRKAVFREVLAAAFPEHKDKIYSATSSLRTDYQNDFFADLVYVVESWHLPSSEDSSDGMRTICIDNCTLLEEPYEKDYFPFSFYRWTKPLLGFYGMGLAEELCGIQLEINKILRNIQLAQHLMAVPQVWLERSSQVIPAHINNEYGGIKWYQGQPPIFLTPQAMSPEIYQHLESLYRKAYQITGISEMSAQSKKPSGVTASVALQTLSDMESERFMTTATDYEDFHIDIFKKVIDMTRDIYVDTGRVKIKAAGQEFMETINWKDVDLKEDQYVMRCYPTNLLPTQPASRLDRIQGMMQAGFFDREEAMSLLDYPDIKSATARITAPKEIVSKMLAAMLDKGTYLSPEPNMNLDVAKKMTQAEYNYARLQNAPDDRLELLRRFMDDCQGLMDQAQAELQNQQMLAQQQAMAAQAPQPNAMAPIAQPEAQPVSELLPVAQ